MNDTTNWKVPKWPFLLGDALLMIFGYFFVLHSPLPIRHWEIAAGCVIIGAALGVIPFILDYRAMGKALEVNALGAVAEKIENLEKLAGQISAATKQWADVQESVHGQAEKTALSAKAIADRMTTEVIEFSDFMKKMNDSEKATLRLEVEKLRRGEAEWLQVLVTVLDHVFALHAGAMRSGDVKFAGPVTNFQNTCYDVARRLGLVPFVGAAGEPFNAGRHKTLDGKEPPAGAVVADTIGCGYTFQGQLLRPALVRLRDAAAPAKPQAEKPGTTTAPAPEKKPAEKPAPPAVPAPGKSEGGFSLESPD
jgi:molecular chaperone GrpE (heat shock protein)